PNIVTIHNFGQRGGLYFFLMEYVDGLSLRQVLNSGGVSPKEAIAIVPQICDALQYAHDRGIVHRDIKPENILMNRQGQVKIADFGLAKLVGLAESASDGAKPAGGPEAPGVTQAGEKVMGTPQYMAPEQIDRPAEVDHRADIYSLGVVFYQMLTGELPVGRFEPPSHKVLIDVRLDEVVLRALEKEPSRRYQQVSQVRTQVETIVATAGQRPDIHADSAALSNGPVHPATYGWEYRSKRTLFGLPLVHVANGMDPGTGRPREARGIIAYGAKARGVIAIGGQAYGVVAVGGFAAGLIAFGGFALGVFGYGGIVLGLFLAYGGLAAGPVAFGGIVAGIYADGGMSWNLHHLPAGWVNFTWMSFYILGGALLLGTIPLVLLQSKSRPRRKGEPTPPASGTERLSQTELARQAVKAPAIGMLVAAGINLAVGFAVVAVILTRVGSSSQMAGSFSYQVPIVPFLVLFVGVIVNCIIFFGAMRMMQLRNRGLAIAAAILALIAVPGNIIGLPMGIWALVVLGRRKVAEAFVVLRAPKAPVKSRIVRWIAAIGALVLIGLVVRGVWGPSTVSRRVPVYSPPSDPQEAQIWHGIQLLGVSPDGGDDLLDAEGKLIGKSLGMGLGPWDWRSDSQARALVFDIPQSPELQWAVFPEVYVSETGRRLGVGMNGWTADFQGKRRRILALTINRTYPKSGWFRNRAVPIDRIDVILKYYLPGRGKAACTFTGPFEVGKVVRCQEGSDCTLTPTGTVWRDGRGTKFHISASIDIGDEQVLAYDAAGKRYFVSNSGGKRSRSGNHISAEKDYYIQDLPLSRVAVITIGEQPQKKTFQNILVRYPDRPAKDYPEYLDKMASALGLASLSSKQLHEYNFKSADEALKVIDIIRGPHIDRAWQIIQSSRIDFADFPQDVREKLRRTAKTWSDNGITCGIEMGLKGQWSEFVAPALALLSQDHRHRSEVAHSLQAYRLLTPQDLDQIATILEQRDDPRGMYRLLFCLNRRPEGSEAALRLARSDKVWLWWPALGYLTGRDGLTLGQLPRDLQVKYLARFNPDLGLDPVLAAEAKALLAKLPTAKLVVMNADTFRGVTRSVAKNLPRAEAQAAMLDLLQDLVDHWGDYQVEGYSLSTWWAIDRAVRYLNNWNKLNLGGVGTDVGQETSESHSIDWPALAKTVLAHFGRIPARRIESAVPEKTQTYKITLIDALDQPIPKATLDLHAATHQRSLLRPRLLQGGPQIRVQTDSRGKCKIDWPLQPGKRQVYSFTGRASHPDYGIAPVRVYSSRKTTKTLLVKKGSPQYERALKGQVVDEAGQPVAGASVESSHVLTPWMSGQGNAITDSKGRFVMHLLPHSKDDKKRLLPSDAKYSVVARAPAGMDLFPVRMAGKSPMRLVLRMPTLQPRRLRFEVGGNQYAQGDERDCIRLTWNPIGSRAGEIYLEARYISGEPVRLIPGRYLARYHDGHGRSFHYLPVKIDESSPEVITFRRPPAVTYHGQVVDGITGKPVAGAFVFTYEATTGNTNLAMLLERDWRNLEAMPDQPSLDDPGVKVLNRRYIVEAIMRTDANGRYELTRGREQGAISLIALSKNCLPMKMRLSKLKADGQQRTQVPAIAMFPAAYVKLYPKVPVGVRVSVYPKWAYQAEGQPKWFQRFQKSMKGAGFPPRLDVSGPVRLFVPAGVRLKLRFWASRNSSYVAEPNEHILDLSPGETKDLGELKFVPSRKPTRD
ncbi:MAG: protein kinase, partial [Phycisphaerae bacterium]|nr:protein kinase [Phycisphaerae bacterium]